MDIDKVSSRDMVRQILIQYSKVDIPKELLKKLINELSNDIFYESPATKIQVLRRKLETSRMIPNQNLKKNHYSVDQG
jgi:hypothetical protein